MKLLFLLLISVSVFSQNITISGEMTLDNQNYGVVTINDGAKLTIKGLVNAHNVNIGKKIKITVLEGAYFNVSSSINLNGQDTLINRGAVRTSAVELQNGDNYLHNLGIFEVYQSDLQINDPTSVVENCNQITVKQSFNLNNGKYIACGCSLIESGNLNVGVKNGVTGIGSLRFNSVNLNNVLTNSKNIYVFYKGTVNTPSNWGTAQLNSTKPCETPPLPVKVVKTDFKANEYYLELTDQSNLSFFEVEESDDAKNWKMKKRVAGKTNQFIYKGKLEGE